NKFDAWSASVGFKMDGLTIDAAFEQHNTASRAMGDKSTETGYRLGAGYSFSGFKVVGIYQRLENVGFSDDSANMFGIGGAYTFGQSTIKGQFYDAGTKHSKDGGQLWALGYDYKLSKQTKLYGQYAYASNDDLAKSFVAGANGGHGENASFDGEPGGDNGIFSIGVVHSF
ncbi:MAG: porin, partial [Halothiobacillaceae bacterium]